MRIKTTHCYSGQAYFNGTPLEYKLRSVRCSVVSIVGNFARIRSSRSGTLYDVPVARLRKCAL